MSGSKMMRRVPILIVISIAIIIWGVFYPAFMNADSIVQYGQALAGNYDDWHPPIMAITLHYFIRLSVGLGAITLIQSILGCVGIYLLSKSILQNFNTSERAYRWFPLGILLFLVTPLTPYSFHIMAFIKDTWVGLGIIWIAYLTLKIWQIKKEKTTKYRFYYFLLFICMNIVVLSRHNAIALLPVFLLILYFLSDNYLNTGKFNWAGILTGLYPILIYIIVSHQINNAWHVTKTHPENQVFATECLGILVNNPDRKSDLPYMAKHLTSGYGEAYIPGNVAPIMPWGPIKAVDSSFDRNSPEFTGQYYALLKKAPFSFMKVKWDGFAEMLIITKEVQWFHDKLDDNPYGLVQNELFKSIRTVWIHTANSLHENIVIRYAFGEHFVWLLINVFILLFFLIKKRKNNTILIMLLLMPLAYYFSYLLASTGPDFRFMYPSTLLVQVITMSLGFIFIEEKILFGKNKDSLPFPS